MASRDQRLATPARSAQPSRRQARQARAQLAAGGLSHQQQRTLRALLRTREAFSRRRHRRLRRLGIALAGVIIAMAIATLSFGLIPAIDAASGRGMAGNFVVGEQVCSSKTGCQWVGTFRATNGAEFGGLAYGGTLPEGDGPGSVIPARYPGGSDQVYALRGSHTWMIDLLVTLTVGAAAGVALWISPLGAGAGYPEGARASAWPTVSWPARRRRLRRLRP